MHILSAYTDQKLAQQGQKNSTNMFTAFTTFRISDDGVHLNQVVRIISRTFLEHLIKLSQI